MRFALPHTLKQTWEMSQRLCVRLLVRTYVRVLPLLPWSSDLCVQSAATRWLAVVVRPRRRPGTPPVSLVTTYRQPHPAQRQEYLVW